VINVLQTHPHNALSYSANDKKIQKVKLKTIVHTTKQRSHFNQRISLKVKQMHTQEYTREGRNMHEITETKAAVFELADSLSRVQLMYLCPT